MNFLDHMFLLVSISIIACFKNIATYSTCLIYLYETFITLSYFIVYTLPGDFYLFFRSWIFFFIDQFFLGIISSFLNFFLNKRWLYLLFLAFVVSKMKKEKHAVVIICRYILNINFLLNISLTGAYKLCCFMFAIYKILFLIVCLVSYFEVCV